MKLGCLKIRTLARVLLFLPTFVKLLYIVLSYYEREDLFEFGANPLRQEARELKIGTHRAKTN